MYRYKKYVKVYSGPFYSYHLKWHSSQKGTRTINRSHKLTAVTKTRFKNKK